MVVALAVAVLMNVSGYWYSNRIAFLEQVDIPILHSPFP